MDKRQVTEKQMKDHLEKMSIQLRDANCNLTKVKAELENVRGVIDLFVWELDKDVEDNK